MTPPAAPDREDAAREHQIFWMLAKGARDHPVGRVYLAIQAALAFGAATADVGRLMGEMMAKGRVGMDASCERLGGGGLAYFSWLFETELVAVGEDDCHVYRFRRRHDGKEVLATLRTAAEPRSLHFQQDYERERRRLAKKRALLMERLRRPSIIQGMARRTNRTSPD